MPFLLHQWNRKWPGIAAHFEYALGIRLVDNPVGLVERQDELAQVIGGLNPIRVFEFIALGAKKGVEPLEIMGVGGSHKRRDRFFRRGEGLASFHSIDSEIRNGGECQGQSSPG